MSINEIREDLHRAERKMRWWGAEKKLFFGLAGVLFAVWLFGLADVFFKFEAVGRWISFLVLCLAVLGLGLWAVRGLFRRLTPQAIAARIERTFPHLDNHLINTIQFSDAVGEQTGWHRHYLKEGVRDWNQIDLRRLRDKREFRQAFLCLGAVSVIIVGSAFFIGAPWQNALARIVNPLSDRPPSVFANILQVSPGNVEIARGESLTLEMEATGIAGQEVFLDLWPEDDGRSRLQLGSLIGDEVAPFRYEVESATSSFHYRFRAGDATSPRYQVTVRAPLSLEEIVLRVFPPSYTGIPGREARLSDQALRLPEGSLVAWAARFSRPVDEGRVVGQDGQTEFLEVHEEGLLVGEFVPDPYTREWRLEANAGAEQFRQSFVVEVEEDRPPTVRIVSPAGRSRIDPGNDPAIRWEIGDDHGLSRIQLFRIDPAQPESEGLLLEEWMIEGTKRSEEVIVPPSGRPQPGRTFAYRVVAWDNCGLDRGPQSAASEPIVFEWRGTDEAVEEQAQSRERVGQTLERLVQMQRRNLSDTASLFGSLPEASGSDWEPLAEVQEGIRRLAGVLIEDPARPLGALTAPTRQLYEGSMVSAVERLEEVPGARPERREEIARRAARHQERILRVLSAASENMEKVEQRGQMTEILGMIDRIIDRQTRAHRDTRELAEHQSAAPATLIDLQDRLGEEMGLFVGAARREAESIRANDETFADLLVRVANLTQERELTADMFRAAEFLEEDQTREAIPPQERVLTSLNEFREWLSEWRLGAAEERERQMAAALDDAANRLEQVVDTQSKIVEGMRAISQQRDLSGEALEMFFEELNTLSGNVRDAALQVAVDLHIFPEWGPINELVEDIFTSFEEVDQVPGSELKEIEEFTVPKYEELLEALEEILAKVEEGTAQREAPGEMWLSDEPDDKRVLTEAFDSEEFPEIANVPLPSEFEDIIGDLLEQQEELKELAENSSVNHILADMPPSDEIGEGNETSFGAQGKSGNEVPDNVEQTGRAIVGRQGMATGETAAGSGTISEGDENIERRRTDDPAQAGHVDVQNENEVQAVATGGGKDSGVSGEHGMSDDVRRRDVPWAEGSELGMQAMLRRTTEDLYAQASGLHIRTGSVDEAILEMRRAEQAIRDGRSIQQIAEHQRRAAAALRRTRAELAGAATALPGESRQVVADDSRFAGSVEEAPSAYRDLVAEYYRALAVGE